jgi:hypothetical protein
LRYANIDADGGHVKFKDKLKNECLNSYLFRTIYEAEKIIKNYIDYYNTESLHSAIGCETPIDFNNNFGFCKIINV